MSESFGRFVWALEQKGCRDGHRFRCPAHDDSRPSLSVREGKDGRVLVKCHSGCAPENIVAALGLTMANLFEANGGQLQRGKSEIVATYDYVSVDGELLFQVCRFNPKGFRQRRPGGNGGWIWNLKGVHRVLFHLPRVLEAARRGQEVYVVEGEKDVQAVEKAGAFATCNPGGAGKWREEYSRCLVGAHCRVVADADEPGRRHARDVAQSLRAADVRVDLLEPAHGKDVSDHLQSGRSLSDLVPLSDHAELTRDAAIHSGDFHPSDMGNAQLFAKLHGLDVRFDVRRGRWLLWTGHHWVPDHRGKRVLMAEHVARKRFEDAWNLPDKGEAKEAARFAINTESHRRIMAMLDLTRSLEPIADGGEDWDRDPLLLGVPNGVVDLRTGNLREGRREDCITMLAGVRCDPRALADRWLRFLHEVFAESEQLIEFIQRAVGYSLTGDVSEQCLFLLHGTGANGKTTFLNAVRNAAGDYGYNMPFCTVEMEGRSSVPNDMAALVGRRLVTSSETNETTRLNEGRIKALTGGDPVTARFLHREFFTFRPVGKFWLAVNHKPRVADDSHGFWRRVHMIPFTQRFSVDKRLEGELMAEAAGIQQWALQGCLSWLERGLEPPDCVRDATEEYRRESDPLEDFIAEFIEVTDEDVDLPVREITAAYDQWAEREGLKPRERLGNRALRSRLKLRWPDRHRTAVRKTPARYRGLRLRGGDS